MGPGLGAESEALLRRVLEMRGETIRSSDQEHKIAAAAVPQSRQMPGESVTGKAPPRFIQGHAMGRRRQTARELGGFIVHARLSQGSTRNIDDHEIELGNAQ